MRGGGGGVIGGSSNLKMGVPNNHGPGGAGGAGDRRPSKLMMMREDYHKKILKEKEEKMVQLYEDSQKNQKKTMMRMMRGGSGEGAANGTIGNGGAGASVRDFFNERRRLEAAGAPIPPIDDHFRQAKGYSSPSGWSSRTGSGNSAKKCSAGRDRSQPLAPIQRPKDTREMARTGTDRGGDRLTEGQPPAAEQNPFNAKPKLVKPKPLPPTYGYANKYLNKLQQDDDYDLEPFAHQGIDVRNQHNFQPPQQQEQYMTDNNNNDKQRQQAAPSQSKFGYQGLHQQKNVQQHRHQPQPQLIKNNNQQQQRQQPQPPPQQYVEPSSSQPPSQRPSPKHQPQNRAGNAGKFKPASQPRPTPQTKPPRPNQRQQGESKLTDFQKWQIEQNKAREERLKKLNTQNKNDTDQDHWGSPNDDKGDDDDDENEGEYGGHSNRGDNRYEDRNDDNDDEEEEDDGQEDEVKRMERELLEKIEREKEELDRIRHEKALAEEEEKREIEENKKREKLEKLKMKKLEEQRKKEEQQRRREEEEDERRERQREEKERREREREEEKRRREEDKRRKEEEKVAARHDKEEQKRLAKLQKQQQGRDSARSMSQGPSYNDDFGNTPAQSSRSFPANAGLTMGDIDDLPAVASAGDSSYYAKIAKSSEAKGSVGSLAKCKVCGRSFAVDRLKKHQLACSKANKPRKEFDSSKKRVEGTELAKYVGRPKKEPPKKKNNWRSQHEEFINSLRYAKKAAQYEKEGKDIRQLTPPPTKENPDLVKCPFCNRTFNETAAQRHIPRCKDLKTKPPPMKPKRR